MSALFLVAFSTFLRKSNLEPDIGHSISPKVPLRSDLGPVYMEVGDPR